MADGTDRATTFRADPNAIDLVNAALHLRRPLLITGKPGTGKSSLIYAVAHELKLGPVLRWSVTSRSTLQQGLYQYDAIGRFQARDFDHQTPAIGDFLTLGPLGTALLPTGRPRALLIDEIDKSDIDLPNDLLNIFEEGEYVVPELQRLKARTVSVTTADGDKVSITTGHVRCDEFPFVVLTSNGEREFPPPFLRRCLRLDMPEPTPEGIAKIVEAHLGKAAADEAGPIIEQFLSRRSTSTLATDQLLNAVFLVTRTRVHEPTRDQLVDVLLRALSTVTAETTT
jgi:MoxR-like ATPase